MYMPYLIFDLLVFSSVIALFAFELLFISTILAYRLYIKQAHAFLFPILDFFARHWIRYPHNVGRLARGYTEHQSPEGFADIVCDTK